MTKRTRKDAARTPVTLKGEGATPEGQATAVAVQKSWGHDIADGIKRGELPQNAHERRVVAAIVRAWADQLHVPKARKRGNPSFARKLPDDDTVAVMVGLRIGLGDGLVARGDRVVRSPPDEPAAAITYVADLFGVDDSTVAKIFRARRDAVADFFTHSNLRHRVGAIRGK
jgi:hypothetical protein